MRVRSWFSATPSGQVTIEFAALLLIMLVLSAYFTYSVVGTFLGVSDVMALIEARYIANYVANAIAGTISWLPDWQSTANQIHLPEKIGNSEYYLKVRVKGEPGGPGEIVVILRLGGRFEKKVGVTASVPILVGWPSGGWPPRTPGVVLIDPRTVDDPVPTPVTEWPPGDEWWVSTSGKPFEFGLYVIPPGG
ncbi:hypothetical protein [Methanopyrus kandleri]|uniref:Uncharacterized protein n=2 Tax=Methanopyrus kandleri TaxID=2320 RepID=Q8TXH9_METKA|nr:hypothetical protein [Methanopyrus kandleri]AAM01909.1 Uncharacterized protein MK0695 [Methanopyrus kandleri AV19]HII70081.1 hypothetical protein [Methanopyrus kandleri]